MATKFTVMESKRDGICNTCRGPIAKGELITWNRADGANHFQKDGCSPQVATDEQKAAYQKTVVKAIKEWDGSGSFRPVSYGEFVASLERTS